MRISQREMTRAEEERKGVGSEGVDAPAVAACLETCRCRGVYWPPHRATPRTRSEVMIVVMAIVVGIVFVVAVLRAGVTDDGGWRFAPMRATGMVFGMGFRLVSVVVGVLFAMAVAVVASAFSSSL
ncbi:hypothetical protein [Rhodococcus sp. 14-2496-1d]|uniref:hypothetical protein n=1 Tax=Rhodococcus sp. 14-2496-1d TaxID=2023146 RepID=UPI00117AA6E2|nr:hypothetical protein [Rhodococcus sp. 14-2496-1d]